MPAVQLPLVAQPHRNQQLFSDYYLDVILPQRPDWKLLAVDAWSVMERIAAIVAAYTPSRNEAQTERDLVQPVLEVLGHNFEVQAAPLLGSLAGWRLDLRRYRRDQRRTVVMAAQATIEENRQSGRTGQGISQAPAGHRCP